MLTGVYAGSTFQYGRCDVASDALWEGTCQHEMALVGSTWSEVAGFKQQGKWATWQGLEGMKIKKKNMRNL